MGWRIIGRQDSASTVCTSLWTDENELCVSVCCLLDPPGGGGEGGWRENGHTQHTHTQQHMHHLLINVDRLECACVRVYF